jgi:hypothetical protein
MPTPQGDITSTDIYKQEPPKQEEEKKEEK